MHQTTQRRHTMQQIKPLPMYEVVELEVIEIAITEPKEK